MKHQGGRLYLFLIVFCLAGYLWIFLAQSGLESKDSESLCPMKLTTDLPCPSCGTTRSVSALSEGHYLDALLINPLGWLAASFLLIVPLWIGIDLTLRSNSLLRAYAKMETLLQKPTVYIPAIAIILTNWIWNIAKGL